MSSFATAVPARISLLAGARAALRLVRRAAVRVMLHAARACTSLRLRLGRPRSVWGTTPILTLPQLARCDRTLGLSSDSLVFTRYHTWRDFDVDLSAAQAWVLRNAPQRYSLLARLVFLYALMRYDVFHYYCDRGILPSRAPMGIDPNELALLRRAGKRIYTYTYGADVRTRTRTLTLGKFNFCMDCPEVGKYCICDDAVGEENIRTINRFATEMMSVGEMDVYVRGRPDLHYWPLDLDRLKYVGVKRTQGAPLRVAHAPNHPHFKGTRFLLQAVEQLQRELTAVELVRVQGVSNDEVLALFATADVIADQFIGGSPGYTALEAMALGKPVLCYLRDDLVIADIDNCPILNVNPETLYNVLRECAKGAIDLADVGRRGRAFVERNYSVAAVAARLGKLYIQTAGFPDALASRLARRVAELERATI